MNGLIKSVVVGVVGGMLIAAVLGFVKLYQDEEARRRLLIEEFILTCNDRGGKAAWNLKHWECLK